MTVVLEPSFLPEVWSWYAAGATWLVLRFFVRIKALGLEGLQLDDFFAFWVLLAWTITCVGISIATPIGTNLDYTADEVSGFSDEEIEIVEYASKFYLVGWYTYIVMVWCLKACVLVFFRRLKQSFHPWQRKIVDWLLLVCAASFMACILTLSLSCVPISDQWRVRPLPPPQCTTRPQDFYTQSTLNIATDAALLCVSVPLVWKLKVPPLKKLLVAILLCEGFFVIIAVIIRVIFSTVPGVTLETIARWGVRELGASIICVNSMILRAMFTRNFWLSNERIMQMQQRARPSLYFFQSIHGRIMGGRRTTTTTTTTELTRTARDSMMFGWSANSTIRRAQFQKSDKPRVPAAGYYSPPARWEGNSSPVVDDTGPSPPDAVFKIDSVHSYRCPIRRDSAHGTDDLGVA